MPQMAVYHFLDSSGNFTVNRYMGLIQKNYPDLDAALSTEIESDDFDKSKPSLTKALEAFNTAIGRNDENAPEKLIFKVARDGLSNYLQSNGQSWDNPATASTQQPNAETTSNAATSENQQQAGASATQSGYQQLIELLKLTSRLEALFDDEDGPATAAINLLNDQEAELKDKTQAQILEHMKAILDDSNQSDLHKGAEFAQTELMKVTQAATSPQENQSTDADASEPPAQTTKNTQKTAASSKLSDLMKPISEVPNKPGSYHVPPNSVGKIMSTVNKNHGGGLNALDKQGYGVIDEAEAQAILGDQKKLAGLVTKMTGIQPNTPNFKAAQDHIKTALQGVGKGGCVGLAVSNKTSRADLHQAIHTATNGQAKFVERKGPSKSARAPTPAPAAKRQRAESSTSMVNDFGGKAYDTTAGAPVEPSSTSVNDSSSNTNDHTTPSPQERQAAFSRDAANGKAGRRLRSSSAPASSTEHGNDDDDDSPQTSLRV